MTTSSLKRPSRPGTLRRKQRRWLHPLARSSLSRRMNPRRTTTRRMTSLRAVVTANARAMQAELRTAAALAGVPKERIPYVLRMCDTEGIDLDAADAQDKLDAAVAKVLEAVPELCGGAGTGNGQFCPQKRQCRGRARRKDSGEHYGRLLRAGKRGKEDGEQH